MIPINNFKFLRPCQGEKICKKFSMRARENFTIIANALCNY